eukprot:scaffold3069_cov227-Prasinococcus_capsulatus_cf.AAC.3
MNERMLDRTTERPSDRTQGYGPHGAGERGASWRRRKACRGVAAAADDAGAAQVTARLAGARAARGARGSPSYVSASAPARPRPDAARAAAQAHTHTHRESGWRRATIRAAPLHAAREGGGRERAPPSQPSAAAAEPRPLRRAARRRPQRPRRSVHSSRSCSGRGRGDRTPRIGDGRGAVARAAARAPQLARVGEAAAAGGEPQPVREPAGAHRRGGAQRRRGAGGGGRAALRGERHLGPRQQAHRARPARPRVLPSAPRRAPPPPPRAYADEHERGVCLSVCLRLRLRHARVCVWCGVVCGGAQARFERVYAQLQEANPRVPRSPAAPPSWWLASWRASRAA